MAIAKSGTTEDSGPTLGKLTRIKGQVTAAEDVFFFGALEGFVDAPAHKVTVGPSAHLTGDVSAREVVVYGTVDGNLAAVERIEILHQAKVTGDVRTTRIMIEDGAYFRGSVDLVPVGSPIPKKRPENARVITEGRTFLVVGE
jgi:cytoskeletal protein CcmA (bactofilin family)